MQKNERLIKNKKLVSDILKEVADINTNNSNKVTLFDIKIALQERGFGILIIIFSLPLSIPIPVPPSYTTILSLWMCSNNSSSTVFSLTFLRLPSGNHYVPNILQTLTH